ncbi:hypothetical protein CFBP6625_06710 [Agrobacterium tumefaciens]|jgi:hypothetical protein|nr:hypothetical protein CFBP6625_06710 [Agrobacterium tumefaciens]
MKFDHGNRGDRVPGVRYAEQDPVADVFSYDRLPKQIRAILRDAPCRLNATETLAAIRDGQSVTQVSTRLLLGIKGYLDGCERERQALS